MRPDTFKNEAEVCRLQALAYRGRPEGPFLLQLAGAFDELALNRPNMSDVVPHDSRRN